MICLIDDFGVWIDQKTVPGRQGIGIAVCLVCAFSAYDIVDQIMVADSRSPLVERIAFLETGVVYGEGDELFLLGFI
jgi:hypothetical protein